MPPNTTLLLKNNDGCDDHDDENDDEYYDDYDYNFEIANMSHDLVRFLICIYFLSPSSSL